MTTRDGRVFVHEIEPTAKAAKKLSAPLAPSTRSKKNKHKSYEDYMEDSTMRELHQIREEMERQQEESGLSVLEWLEATEKDFCKSLAEDGFEIVTRDDRTFIDEIKPRSKRNVTKTQVVQANKAKNLKLPSSSFQSKAAKHKNYDDMIEASRAQELQFVREDRTAADKIESHSKKQPVKYKTTIKRRMKNSRKK